MKRTTLRCRPLGLGWGVEKTRPVHRRAQLGTAGRHGLSLLEVLLALAILGGALAAIGELMRVGVRSAEAARDNSTAQILAESTMSGISAGLLPPETVTQAPVDDPQYQLDWSYSVNVQQVDQEGLISVTVLVQQNPDNFARPVSYSLVRWMIDPEAALSEF